MDWFDKAGVPAPVSTMDWSGKARVSRTGLHDGFLRPNDVLPEKSSFEGDLSGRRPFRWRKVICQPKSGQSWVSAEKVVCRPKSSQSWVSAARYVLIRISYGSPGLSRTDAIPRGLWFGKDPFPVPVLHFPVPAILPENCIYNSENILFSAAGYSSHLCLMGK